MKLYGDYKLEMQTKSISHSSLQRFIDSLDVGDLDQIDGHSGVTKTVTALITTIVDFISSFIKRKR